MRYGLGGWALLLAGLAACGTRTLRDLSTPDKGETTSAPERALDDVGPSGGDRGRVAPDQASVALTGAAAAAGGGDDFGRPETDPSVLGAMIIRSGQASVEADSLDIAVVRIRQLAARTGGYLANVNLQAGQNQLRTATLEIKVPAANFEDLVAGLTPIGKVESVNVTAQDVGEEYTDVAARVANARHMEARIVDILATRTGKLAEVLEVERELARVREEIERYEGRMRYLRTRSAMSSLSITVHEKYPVVTSPQGPSPIADAFREAWRNFIRLVAGLIASLGTVIPVGLTGAAVISWVRRRWRSRPVAA